MIESNGPTTLAMNIPTPPNLDFVQFSQAQTA